MERSQWCTINASMAHANYPNHPPSRNIMQAASAYLFSKFGKHPHVEELDVCSAQYGGCNNIPRPHRHTQQLRMGKHTLTNLCVTMLCNAANACYEPYNLSYGHKTLSITLNNARWHGNHVLMSNGACIMAMEREPWQHAQVYE